MLHGSAGRSPTCVTKTKERSPIFSADDFLRFPMPFRIERATCVSHSEVTQKMCEVNDLMRLEQARVAKVPPECETRRQIELCRLCELAWNEKFV